MLETFKNIFEPSTCGSYHVTKEAVTSVGSYLEAIELALDDRVKKGTKDGKDGDHHVIYRGEAGGGPDGNGHEKRRSAAFRLDEKGRCRYETSLGTLRNFYDRVVHRIDEKQRRHFPVFARHYGIDTSLLDVTYDHLVALFMACCKPENEPSDMGYVYILNKEYVNVTDIIDGLPKHQTKRRVSALLRDGDKYVSEEYYHRIKNLFHKFGAEKINSYIFQIVSRIEEIDKYPDIRENEGLEVKKKCKEVIEMLSPSSEDININYKDLHKILLKICEMLYSKDKSELPINFKKLEQPGRVNDQSDQKGCVKDYVNLLIYYLNRVQETHAGENFMPPMIYKPLDLFERARVQNALFIMDVYERMYEEGSHKRKYFPLQDIKFEFKIKIERTGEILKELDDVFDINFGEVYYDFDSMAKYIKGKAKES
ncbi:MAG: FRG domain-containing protein [Defluviitaleaceae bacterium]|nr:FRG domain-containing protein [Defluviitaleaceae bacterium]